MSTNISKQKRDDLISKIKAIRAYISAAPQDENTGKLLTYLSDLEKDVNGKKYGLVFEEHQEGIDQVLKENTPVLTEQADLLLDNGGEMNFLLEGDNLAALKLLEKTHKGRIDVIYIDPPYNKGDKDFTYPKPLALISEIIQRTTSDNSIVLDFFAGSGTTGHAVMKLNAEDDGNRKFILCTNNENNICRNVTYERIKRVIEKENYDASLKYYRIDYVPISQHLYYEYADELLKHVRELVELENGINFTGNAEIAIVLTDEELVDFIAHPEAFDECRSLYLGHDILLSGEQEELLKEREIAVHIIPDYYYRELEG